MLDSSSFLLSKMWGECSLVDVVASSTQFVSACDVTFNLEAAFGGNLRECGTDLEVQA